MGIRLFSPATTLSPKLISIFFFLLFHLSSEAQEFSWMDGNSHLAPIGIYGEQGVPDPANIPGARTEAVTWTDQSGNLWLFGGMGFGSIGSGNGRLNDLWKWDGTQWTWMSGSNTISSHGNYGTINVSADSNMPSARHRSVSWVDASGNLWLFGGTGWDVNGSLGRLNDLWKWDGSQWTWVSGSNTINASSVYGTINTPSATNVPGAREFAASWVDDSNNFWMFGGIGYAAGGEQGYLNDLWKWDGTHWTWVSGSTAANASGVYGSINTPAASNVPGARQSTASWIDSSGDVWIFGGSGQDLFGASGALNDLWKWDGSQWTWVSGSNEVDDIGDYGTIGQASASNKPGARQWATNWIDASDNLWLFGGYGYDRDGTNGRLNDTWKWDGSNWTWIGGDVTRNGTGEYGTQNVASSANVPGARYISSAWTDASGNFWLFGGNCIDSKGASGYMKDLWKWDGTDWTWVDGNESVNNAGNYGELNVSADDNQLSGRYSSLTWEDNSGNVWVFGGYGYDNNGLLGHLNDLWKWDGNQWTWVSGSGVRNTSGDYGTINVAASSNIPGSRYGATGWVDEEGNLWLFGGQGYAGGSSSGRLNDLWKWDGSQWTWVNGNNVINANGSYGVLNTPSDTNVPKSRMYSVGWKDTSGNFWLFGGTSSSGSLNDLWKWDGSQWTWVNGSGSTNIRGTYGTIGSPAASNIPGSRYGATSWLDASGDFWLFGGQGYDYSGLNGRLNDLWKWDGSEWTWVSGSNASNELGVYGTINTTTASNVPGGRNYPLSWVSDQGDVYLFGGSGYDESGTLADLNDWWKWDGTNWTWMAGSNLTKAAGEYGELGTPSETNVMGARNRAISWTNASGDLWLHGGYGYEASGTLGVLNDLWKISFNSAPSFTSFSQKVASTNEDEEVEVSLSALLSFGDENDVDGTVDGFRVTSVTSGSLKLGASTGAATSFDASNNNLIDATTNAYWTPDANVNGETLSAFEVVAIDNKGSESENPVSATIDVIAVNDQPVFTSVTTAGITENTTNVLDVDAHDGDGGSSDSGITYGLSGADSEWFNIDASGNITFNAAPDFENPLDSNGDNDYEVTITADDGELINNQTTQEIVVTVSNENEAPQFESAAVVDFEENGIGTVIDVSANDGDGGISDTGITYAISGGTDQLLFEISAVGEVSFLNAPDFESTSDENSDNVYELEVSANDGTFDAKQLMLITVVNANDNAPVFSSGEKVDVVENNTEIQTISATDEDGSAIAFSISGGEDQLAFKFSSDVLEFVSAPDFENPSDTNSDNVYEVEVIASDGMHETRQSLLVTVTDLVDEKVTLEVSSIDEFKAYPNPAMNTLTIESLNTEAVILINLQGKEVLKAMTNESIDVSKLKVGLYFLKIEKKEERIGKVMIAR